MASTRELWILLRARDEASRVVSSFSKNVRAAALAAQAAQKSAQAAAVRQQAQLLRTNGATAQQIRGINQSVVALEKQARAQTLAAATARERRAGLMAEIGSELKNNNLRAASLERQARTASLVAAKADEQREALIRNTGTTKEQIATIDKHIATNRRRAATLGAEAALYRSYSNSLIAQTERENVGLDNSIRSYERRAAAIRAQAAVLRNQSAELKSNLDSQVRAINNQAIALDSQANSLRKAANNAREHDIMMRKLRDSMGKVSEGATVMAFSLGLIGVGGLIGLKSAIDTTVEYDRQVRHTATQVDGFGASLQEIGDIGRRVANEIAVPFESIQPALFDIFGSMEVNLKDAEMLLRAFSKAAVAGQVDIREASRATIGMLNAFRRPAKDVNHILDMQFQLIQEGIGTYEEWNEKIGNVTPSAVRAGQSIETMLAALATATRMGMNTARATTAVSRAFDALSHPKAVKMLKELGVAAVDAKGNFRPFVDVMTEFKEKLQKLPAKGQLGKIEKILEIFKGAGGTIEARKFLQGILLTEGGLETLQTVFDETSESAGSLENAYKLMADSTAAKTELLRNKWQLLKEAIGELLLPQFENLIEKLQELIDWFNELPKSTQKTITSFLLWGSVISIVVGAIFGLIAVIAILSVAMGTLGGAGLLLLGILLLIPAAILAIGYGLYQLYQNSEEVRELFNSIRDFAQEAWNVLSDFAQDVATQFREKLLPSLKELWQTIENEVLPKVKDFVDYMKDKLIPKLKEAADIIKDVVTVVFLALAYMIENIVIPAIEDVTKAWEENEESLRPVIDALGEATKWALITAAIFGGAFVVGLAGAASAAMYLHGSALRGLIKTLSSLVNGARIVIDWIKRLHKGMGDLIQQFDRGKQRIVNAVNGIRDGVRNALAGLPGILFNIGSMSVGGFIEGLRSRIGEVKRAASALGIAAEIATKAALIVKSPSKKFRDIGYAVVQGLIKGINGSRQQLKDALSRLMRDVMNSLKEGKASKTYQKAWENKIKGITKKLLDLEKKRSKITAKLETAQKNLADLKKERSDLSSSIRDRLAGVGDLTSIDAVNPRQVVDVLKTRLEALRQFQRDLLTLQSRGLNKDAIAEMAKAGVENAGGMARMLAESTGNEIQEINSLQKQINQVASQVGDRTAGLLYDAGIKAAEGLVKGLQSQEKAITKQMEKIADALIKSIKKKLGIKSPSKVFEGIGINTALGYIMGYRKQMMKHSMHGEMLAIRPKQLPTWSPAAVGDASGSGRVLYQTISIKTNEIDPRLHAAQLGFELDGRIK